MAGLTVENPVTLTNALRSGNVLPGDVLLLRAGTYVGNWLMPNTINGNAGNYVTIKPYPGEHVIIDGQFQIRGSYIRVIGLESTNSTARLNGRVTTGGFDCQGDYQDIVNCIIHDHAVGIATSKVWTGHNYYGNLVYFCGNDDALGHGMYPQNNTGNVKTIKHNIAFENFGYGIHCYGSNGSVQDFTIDGNTCFENGALREEEYGSILVGGPEGNGGSTICNNLCYNRIVHPGSSGATIYVGQGNNAALDMSVYDNYVASTWRAINITPNTTFVRFDGNTGWGYMNCDTIDMHAEYPNNNYMDEAAPITYPASGNHIVVQANEYDANRANLTIYNWDLANTVTVDLTALGWTGQVRARNVQDYFVDIQTLTISDGSITVNMQAANRSVAAPVGWSAPPTTFPQFGAFVLERIV